MIALECAGESARAGGGFVLIAAFIRAAMSMTCVAVATSAVVIAKNHGITASAVEVTGVIRLAYLAKF